MVADELIHYKLNLGSEKDVHPCIKHSFKMGGNGSVINHTSNLFQ